MGRLSTLALLLAAAAAAPSSRPIPGGWKAPGSRGSAPRVEEVVRYDDRDGNGFLDT